MLEGRLERLVQVYKQNYGVDVSSINGAGAAGGLAGGLVALGATLVPGFEMVADETQLAEHLKGADLVITGEGQLDITSFEGKVVGGVAHLAYGNGVPVAAIVGRVHPSAHDADDYSLITRGVIDLVETFGEAEALAEPKRCVEQAARSLLQRN